MFEHPKATKMETEKFIKEFPEYMNGKISEPEFRSLRAMMGIYQERFTDTFMLRPRITSGMMTIAEFEFYTKLAIKHGDKRLHFTTRQAIQFHGVTAEELPKLMSDLLEKGISGRGTGGNAPRAIGIPPTSGVEKDEVFDVTPHGYAATWLMLRDNSYFNLPRKYKPSIANSEKNSQFVKISDLGLLAVIKDGERGFKVYGGGGLGAVPKEAVVLYEFIPEEDYLYHIEAMKQFFEAEGDRTNRAKARIRYILMRMGEEKFIEEYRKYVEKVKTENPNLINEVPQYKVEYIKKEGTIIDDLPPFAEKSNIAGRYNIYIHPLNGNMYEPELVKLIDVLKALEYEPSIRLTQSQGFLIREVDGKDLWKIKHAAEKTADTKLFTSIACTGAATCKLGILRSQTMLEVIRERFAEENLELQNVLPKLNISGCPNACGQHHIGEIGFWGKNKRAGDYYAPYYVIMVGAEFTEEKAKLAKTIGELPAKSIPEFLVALAKSKLEKGQLSFKEYTSKYEEELKTLVEKYSKIPTVEENPDYYIDFGKTDLIKA